MSLSHTSAPSNPRQQGAALVTGLIFIVVLTIIGITAARMASLEERMAGNMRDRALALQAAELGLRDAERDILGRGSAPRGVPLFNFDHFANNCDQDTGTTEDDGLCDGRAVHANPIWTTVNMAASPSVAYGRFTGAATIPLVSAQPRYILERFQKEPAPGDEDFSYYYRITVRALGANPNTVVWLQEIFKP